MTKPNSTIRVSGSISTGTSLDQTVKATGSFVNYYLVNVKSPQRMQQEPYQAECEDIIQALGMNFDEGCLFKALWRSAAARQGNTKPGHDAIYDAQKMNHYARRILKSLEIKT